MKTVLKTLLVAISLTIASNLNAQIEVIQSEAVQPKKVTFQVRGGVNLSNMIGYKNGYSYEAAVKAGYNIGGIADISLGKNFYFQPGLILTSKGAKLKQEQIKQDGIESGSINTIFLQVPIYFVYKINMPRWNNSFNIALGPYVGYGIGGKTTSNGANTPVSLSVDSFGDLGGVNRLDVGLGMEVQLELKKIVFTLGSEAGFTRALKQEFVVENVGIRNSTAYLSVGIKL